MNRNLAAALLLCLSPAACGKGEDSVAKKAGKVVGGTLTDFGKGVGQGVDERLAVPIELSPELAQAGLSKTVANKNGNGIAVYLLSTSAFKGALIARARNKEGLEIGRAATDVELGVDDAKYVTFAFPGEMDFQLATRYEIGVKK